jgi:hypothetical protein
MPKFKPGAPLDLPRPQVEWSHLALVMLRNQPFVPDMILELGDVASPRCITLLEPLFDLTHLYHELRGGDFSPSDSGRYFSISSFIRWNNFSWGCLTLVFTECDLPLLLSEGDVRSRGLWRQFR